MALLEKTKQIIKKLPDKKVHIEFISALLSIPVMITVIILNINSLTNTKLKSSITPTPNISSASSPKHVQAITSSVATISPQPTPKPGCIQQVAPIDITYPAENQQVSNNPLCIDINYNSDGYCSSVWAYKINGGGLSDYSNSSVCLYNLPSGQNTFTLQIKSLVSSDIKTIERHFIYNPTITPTLTPSPMLTPTPSVTASSSGTIQ